MPDRRLIYTDPVSGLPTEILAEIEVWGFGTLATRPPAGSEVGDLFWLIDGATIRPQVWDGANWVNTTAIPAGGAGGDLQGSYPNPTINPAVIPVFGQGYQRQVRTTPATTTSAAFQTYTTLSIPADTLDPAGEYRVHANWLVTGTSAGTDMQSGFVLNGANVLWDVFLEAGVTNAAIPCVATYALPGADNTGTPLDFEIDFRRLGGVGSAGVSQAIIEIWRVS